MRKVWDFLWNSDSILSWLAFLVVAFLLIKLVFFPFLSLMLSSPLPLVIVESTSMHHPGSTFKALTGLAITEEDSFERWWEKHSNWYEENGIKYENTEDWKFKSGMDMGDIVVVRGVKPEQLKIGDIIIFDGNQKHPVIHRIVDIEEKEGGLIFQTKGDNNNIPGYEQFYFEKDIPSERIIGKAILKVPKLGWLKLLVVNLLDKLVN